MAVYSTFASQATVDTPAPVQRYKVKRPGQRPLVFDGLLIWDASNTDLGTHTIRLWEMRAGGFVVQVVVKSDDEAVSDGLVRVCETAEAVMDALEAFDPSRCLCHQARSMTLACDEDFKAAVEAFETSLNMMMVAYAALVKTLTGRLLETGVGRVA